MILTLEEVSKLQFKPVETRKTSTNLIGQRFGNLIVENYLGKYIWLCKCDCGSYTTILGSNLKNKRNPITRCKNCADISLRTDLKDQVFGKLKVIEFAEMRKNKSFWLCLCECGIKKIINGNSLNRKQTVSCGCNKSIAINNPNYGGKYSKGLSKEYINKFIKGKTYEERYGKEKADIIKKKIFITLSNKFNNTYGKPSPLKSGNGWSGYYEGHYFRSLLEFHYLKVLIDNNILFESGELKQHRIAYELEDKKRTYYPDFYLIETQELVEIKPKGLLNLEQNQAKFKAAKLKLGEKFKVITEKDLIFCPKAEILELIKDKKLIFDDKKVINLNKLRN